MEKKTVVSLSQRISFVKKIKRALKGDKSLKSFIIVTDGTETKAWMNGDFNSLCLMIDNMMEKSEEMDRIVKVVAIKRALMDMSEKSIDKLPERLKEIMKEIKEEKPSETKEEEVKSDQNQQQNEHAE